MPWLSKAQAAWGHSPSGIKALGGAAKVREFDQATPKGSLPDKVRYPGALGKAKQKVSGIKRTHVFDNT